MNQTRCTAIDGQTTTRDLEEFESWAKTYLDRLATYRQSSFPPTMERFVIHGIVCDAYFAGRRSRDDQIRELHFRLSESQRSLRALRSRDEEKR